MLPPGLLFSEARDAGAGRRRGWKRTARGQFENHADATAVMAPAGRRGDRRLRIQRAGGRKKPRFQRKPGRTPFW
jgi:hypothetical protein